MSEYQLYECIRVDETTQAAYQISTDKRKLDLDIIHGYLTESYWSPGVPKALVDQAIEHSLCFGLYHQPMPADFQQIGFARVVTDYTSFAYLADVFVLPAYQGKGLGTWMIDCVIKCPAIDGIRSFFLATRDAHGLYEKFGFSIPVNPARIMIKRYEMSWYRPELMG